VRVLCFVAAVLMLVSCSSGSSDAPAPTASSASTTSRTTPTTHPPTTTTLPTLHGWTTRRLVAQLLMVGAQYIDPAASAAVVRDGAGGLVFFGEPSAGSGPGLTAALTSLRRQAAVKPWFASDEEGGGIQRLAALTGALPWPRDMREQWSPTRMATNVARVASEMRALGVNMDLAPVVDAASADDPVDEEARRSFDEHGTVAANYGLAFLRALKHHGVVGVAKHFPGLGHADGNTDNGPASVPPLAALERNDLVPFQAAIAGGVPVVMMSNATEPDWGSRPASLNQAAYAYLRALGFDGVILTDALEAGAVRAAGVDGPQAAVQAIEAGADMAMITNPSDYDATVAGLVAAVDSGELPRARVVRSVQRILAAKRSG
jgi:beta-N-acetylhexosaminidase